MAMPETVAETPVLEALRSGPLTPDDVIGHITPLLEQVIDAHERGRVAPLAGVDRLWVSAGHIWFREADVEDGRQNSGQVKKLERPLSKVIDVQGLVDWTQDFSTLETDIQNRQVGEWADRLERPIYLPGYVAWEHALDHHDPLTDTFVIGQILASLALGLDFTEKHDVDTFARARGNLFELYPKLHPVLEKAIVQTTELDRHRRLQDLRVLLHRLKNYRDLRAEPVDLDKAPGLKATSLASRHGVLLSMLRDRLFEISRRNRLLYFKATAGMSNLTEASVPVLMHLENIRSEQLFLWSDRLRQDIIHGREIPLKRTIRFEDIPYLNGQLDQARSQARRDSKEFGFSQLRLVLAFLRWHNLKEAPKERIHSPLLLLPIELEKKRGIRDSYWIRATSPIAEINPALRYHLKQLYNLDLPEALDLEASDPADLHKHLEAAIKESEPSLDLQLIDKPRIDLIYAKARQRLDRYRQKARLSGRGIRQYQDVDFSYSRSNYQPLGLQLFQRKVKPIPVPLTLTLEGGEEPPPVPVPSEKATEPTQEKRRTLYSLSAGTNNPYTWEFDLCAMTIGNFNYRKMTLVRDYTSLIEGFIHTPTFDKLFDPAPREVDPEPAASPQLHEIHPVVDCDPTQAQAIASCHERESVIIQGPPGTGKSQTITNLIADFVAKGKRVLFVCEKRAAIDVVYHRLKGRGLHHLCCLIHDSQTDKKAFVLDLRARYEAYITREPPVSSLQRRQQLASEAERLLSMLSSHETALRAVDEKVGTSAHALFRRLIELEEVRPELDAAQEERLPFYGDWAANEERVEKINDRLVALGHSGPLSQHPLAVLEPTLLRGDQPLATIADKLESARASQTALDRSLEDLEVPAELKEEAVLAHWIPLAESLRSLAERRLLGLLEAGSPEWQDFEVAAAELDRAEDDVREAKEGTAHWTHKLPADEAEAALSQAKSLEGSALAFLKPAYWSLRKVMRASYDLEAHTIKPSWSQVLERLLLEHRTTKSLASKKRVFEEQYGPSLYRASLDELRRQFREGPQARPLLEALRQGGLELVDALHRIGPAQEQLDKALKGFLRTTPPRHDLPTTLDALEDHLRQVPDLAAIVGDVMELPAKLANALLDLDLETPELEAAIAWRSLENRCRDERTLTSLPMTEVNRHLMRLDELYRQLMAINATTVLTGVVNHFRRNLQISAMPTSQLSKEDKAFKKAYLEGRKILEREFNKTMRYRAIRELMEAESGSVIRDLKPVWLMSPLSVADTLPLEPELFDVVVFDEASQIPVEEAIPALFRAKKMIVVGDEMQLPPTNFFSSKTSDGDEGDDDFVELESDSFLSLASKQLPTTMLGWHYRSRSEALISFSNACFYRGELLTIPDNRLRKGKREPIRATEPTEARQAIREVLARSISYHRMTQGVYESRRNAVEARYIAHLVAGLLASETDHTLGIVAFSEAQQTEIELALEELAGEDPDFRGRLDRELERETDDQFAGLFIKNLENVQGDERDIIVLSICYGPDASGRMRMSFGPINQNGGEKRLNVIFSRAKHHMVVVSSIDPSHITNVYNDGALCFRRYLEYAAAVSEGRHEGARRVLAELHQNGHGREKSAQADPVARGLRAALDEIGYDVDLDVGESGFLCDVAIHRPDEERYRLGLLVDSPRFYEQGDVLERYLLRPQLLESFGWDVMMVKTADWHADRERVLDGILRRLEGKERAPERAVVAVEDPYAALVEGEGLSADERELAIAKSFGSASGKVDYGKAIPDNIQATVNVDVHESIADLRQELLSKLSDLEEWVDGDYRKAAYRNGAKVLEGLSDDEIRTRITFKDLKGIGKSLNEIVLEYRKSGKIGMWERLAKRHRK